MNIFVTVGTGRFDKLVKAVDELTSPYKIVMQIGDGRYVPRRTPFFRYASSLVAHIDQADLIITHGGAATLLELLKKNKKVIAAANFNRTDKHQEEILKELEAQGTLIWLRDLRFLEKAIVKARSKMFKPYFVQESAIGEMITGFLRE